LTGWRCLHLGYVGLELTDRKGNMVLPEQITGLNQELDLWEGIIHSLFMVGDDSATVKTAVHPDKDRLAVSLRSPLIGKGMMRVNLRFPYPTGEHTDDVTDWSSPEKHQTKIVAQDEHSFVLKRTLDSTLYYVTLQFEGARWMKMTDPSATEAPSSVGSFLIWQQPHFIYMAELIYRNKPTQEVLQKYGFLVEETARFMASFATYDESKGRYVLKGIIPAQETLRASETINPPFELSYWHYARIEAAAPRLYAAYTQLDLG
jgi:hypothetical protein